MAAREAASIYRSPAAAAAIAARYRSVLARWPVDHEDVDVPTRYGSVRVIVSGPETGGSVLLCHGASMASISWLPNVAALTGAGFRTYAVDHIGEAGMSVLDDPGTFPGTPEAIGRLYASIADHLGVEECAVVGASAGGHAAMRFALQAPERVRALVLLGPMGITPLGPSAALRMMLVRRFPSDRRIARIRRRALGTSGAVAEPFGAWFGEALAAVASPPRVGRPRALRSEEMRSLSMPVLLVLGDRDNLVGYPGHAARRAASFPDLRVEIVRSGHLVNVERADDVNGMMVEFLRGAVGDR
jgi:pimeloyl-ACP methyl ester carboxylesterase